MRPFVLVAALAAAALASQAAHAAAYPNAMTGKAKIACDFERDLVFARKVDDAGKYVTPNFLDHNVRMNTTTIGGFKAAIAKMPRFGSAGLTCPPAKVVLTNGDYVTFVRIMKVDDPVHKGQKVDGSHFDVYRFEGDKIAEHWD